MTRRSISRPSAAARAWRASPGAMPSWRTSGPWWRQACVRCRPWRPHRSVTWSPPRTIGRSEVGDLFWASMTELARMIATKAVSPVEVVRAHLDRIAALDGALRAYITVCGDAALAAARAAEAELMAGRPV